MFLLMMMKRSMTCHKIKILVMLLNHLKFNPGGPTGRDNLLGGINVILTDDGEPECFREAVESEEKRKWLDEMKFEACCVISSLAVTST